MDNRITTECGAFSYQIKNDSYVVITGFFHKNGEIPFSIVKNKKYDTEYRSFLLTIPETIEDLPVLRVRELTLEPELSDPYCIISLRIPEGCAFFGFYQAKSKNQYFWPEYEVEYYPRKDPDIFTFKQNGITLIATPTQDGGCRVLQMSGEFRLTYTYKYELYATSEPETLIIPAVINDRQVTSIGDHTECLLPDSLKEICIPDTVETIGRNAFRNLRNLQTVRFGKGLQYVGENAFSYFYEDRESYTKPIPILTVYYYSAFESPDSAFSRVVESWIGEEYKDWGWMQTGSETNEYAPVFVQIGMN